MNSNDEMGEAAGMDEVAGSVLDRNDEEFFSAGAGAVINEEIDTTSVEVAMARDGLLGSMVKTAMESIQGMPSHWGILNDRQREDLVADVRKQFSPLVHQAVRQMAAKGRRIVTGTIDKTTTKDSIQVVINSPRSPEACAAFGMSAGGGQVAFLLLDTESLLTDSAKILMSDQIEMDLGENDENGMPEESNEINDECPL